MSLPKARSFNKIVTLDLKEFGSTYVLWMLDSFIRFIQGKLLNNKKADTIIQALTDTWCMNVGFPSQGFFGNNGGEFANIKLDELTSKLGLSVRFGPAYSPWNNSLNESNNVSAGITIKKMMEENKTPLSDSLVKAASWTHNTSINKLCYSPLQLMIGKAVTLPGLTTGNVATESMTDTEVVQRTLENLAKKTSEFHKANMKRKLKECQGIRVLSYQHLDEYVEGDLVWYQPLNGNSWLGLAAVLCQRGQSVWIHSAGDIRKVASFKPKPFQLNDRKNKKDSSKEMML